MKEDARIFLRLEMGISHGASNHADCEKRQIIPGGQREHSN
jgi:hypothetical protein